jgi:hypothetical protein
MVCKSLVLTVPPVTGLWIQYQVLYFHRKLGAENLVSLMHPSTYCTTQVLVQHRGEIGKFVRLGMDHPLILPK